MEGVFKKARPLLYRKDISNIPKTVVGLNIPDAVIDSSLRSENAEQILTICVITDITNHYQ